MYNFDRIDLPSRNEADRNADFIRSCIHLLDRNRNQADPGTQQEMIELQRRLFDAGRHDIALGRIFEGHVDALQIIHRYGSAEQLDTLKRTLENSAVLGVWNAEGPHHHLQCDGPTIRGGKSYASGAGILTHALVTSNAGTPQVQLHLVDLKQNAPEIDHEWWHVAGMQASQTHRVTWLRANAVHVGTPGNYEREPWFSGGALRFATVQAGGLAGLCDAVCAHLTNLGRAGGPIQQHRLAELYAEASAAAHTVGLTGQAAFNDDESTRTAHVANARNIVYACAERGIAIAQRACGTAAYFTENPVCRFAQDLGMYIRQPGPDAQKVKVGAALAAGKLELWPWIR